MSDAGKIEHVKQSILKFAHEYSSETDHDRVGYLSGDEDRYKELKRKICLALKGKSYTILDEAVQLIAVCCYAELTNDTYGCQLAGKLASIAVRKGYDYICGGID